MKNATPPPTDPHFEWRRVTDGNWALFPNHARDPVAHITPAADGLWFLMLGASRCGPHTRQHVFDLAIAYARSKLTRHKCAA
jgi:hypothetical protein